MPIRLGDIAASRASIWPRDHSCRTTSRCVGRGRRRGTKFLPVSMPIVVMVAIDLSDMAALHLTLAPSQHHSPVGQEHWRTIPLAEIQPSRSLPRDFGSGQAVDFLSNGIVANAMKAAERLIRPGDMTSAVILSLLDTSKRDRGMGAPTIIRATFPGSSGDELAARLELPLGPVRAFALFAHCFSCTKDTVAARRI